MDSNTFNYFDLAIAAVALIVSIAAFWIAKSAIRYQILVLIHDQMGEKARECNSFIKDQGIDPKRIVNLLFSLVTAGQILDEYLTQYNRWHIKNQRQNILDVYYLQLHVAIRRWLFNPEFKANQDLENDTMRQQFKDCVALLIKSYSKFNTGE